MVLNENQIKKFIINDDWNFNNESIDKSFKFTSYMDGIKFVNKIAELAENKNHHPNILIGWCSVNVRITSHDMGGVTNQCVELANEIDLL